MKKVLNVVVNYANEAEVLAYANTLSNQSMSEDIALVVVINKSSENPSVDLSHELQKLNIQTHIFGPEHNRGYFNGFMHGYNEYVKEGHDLPLWTILSNTDLIIEDKDAFKNLFEHNYEQNVGCIGPSIFNQGKQTYDNPKYKTRIPKEKIESTLKIHQRPLLSHMYLTLGNYKARQSRKTKKESQTCYALQGCFIAFKREFMHTLQNNTYEAFLFSEENYVSELLLQNKLTCFYNANVEIIHNEKQATGLLGYKNRAKFYASSLQFIRDKFYSD